MAVTATINRRLGLDFLSGSTARSTTCLTTAFFASSITKGTAMFLLIAAPKAPIAILRETRPTASVWLDRNAYVSKYPDVAG